MLLGKSASTTCGRVGLPPWKSSSRVRHPPKEGVFPPGGSLNLEQAFRRKSDSRARLPVGSLIMVVVSLYKTGNGHASKKYKIYNMTTCHIVILVFAHTIKLQFDNNNYNNNKNS